MTKHQVELGGKMRSFKFGVFAIAQMEEAAGESTVTLEFLNRPSFKKALAVIWAGLLHEAPRLEKLVVAKWLDEVATGGTEKLWEIYNIAVRALLESQGIDPDSLEDEDGGETEKKGVPANG